MHNNTDAKSIFKAGSKTFFYSSIFFPQPVKSEVFTLYSFVRIVDDYVDTLPQKKTQFYSFRKQYEKAQLTGKSQNPIIADFVELTRKKNIKPVWVTSFLDAMESDLSTTRCKTIVQTNRYMYGSAEVIGLMMASILGLPSRAYESAQMLGRAFQYINFIRDVSEDLDLGRIYLPQNEYQKLGLETLEFADTKKNPQAFSLFINEQLARYTQWYSIAQIGFKYIPSRYRIPIQTAADMYDFTAQQIKKNPYLIYEKKIKPNKYQVLSSGIRNTISAL
jgi:phytoene synthase